MKHAAMNSTTIDAKINETTILGPENSLKSMIMHKNATLGSVKLFKVIVTQKAVKLLCQHKDDIVHKNVLQ